MAKFFAGLLIGALSIVCYQNFSSSDEAKTTLKDTITVQMGDQTIEVPKDTFKNDSIR